MLGCRGVQTFCALGLSPTWLSPVLRLRVTPPTTTVVEALITVVPVIPEVRVTWQLPVPPAVVQLEALRLPGPLTMVTLMMVPSGAATYPPPPPSLTFTVEVRTWLVPTGLVAVGGEITILASTQVLLALPLSRPLPSPVLRFSVTPFSITLVEAFTTVTPGVAEVSVTEQLPVASTVAQLEGLRLPGPLPMMAKLMVVPAAAFT